MTTCTKCKTLVPIGTSRCPRHQITKASSASRGYDSAHKALRAKLKPIVAQGQTLCASCGKPILPWQEWDLGHASKAAGTYRGPEHSFCNRSAGGKNNQYAQTRPVSL